MNDDFSEMMALNHLDHVAKLRAEFYKQWETVTLPQLIAAGCSAREIMEKCHATWNVFRRNNLDAKA